MHVTINRPERRNALDQTVLRGIRTIFEDAAADDRLLFATIRGAGERCFAAGGDLRELDTVRSVEQTRAMIMSSRAALDAIREFPVPVIAVLNGDAIGGGAELALACDMRVFAGHARMIFAQGRLCVAPAWGGGVDLLRLVGSARALRFLARAETVDAPTALSMGLADWVAGTNESIDAALAGFTAPVCERKPHVLRAYKKLARATQRALSGEALQALEVELASETWLHPDHWEAAAELLSKISNRVS